LPENFENIDWVLVVVVGVVVGVVVVGVVVVVVVVVVVAVVAVVVGAVGAEVDAAAWLHATTPAATSAIAVRAKGWFLISSS
jgi:hypothetical protein